MVRQPLERWGGGHACRRRGGEGVDGLPLQGCGRSAERRLARSVRNRDRDRGAGAARHRQGAALEHNSRGIPYEGMDNFAIMASWNPVIARSL